MSRLRGTGELKGRLPIKRRVWLAGAGLVTGVGVGVAKFAERLAENGELEDAPGAGILFRKSQNIDPEAMTKADLTVVQVHQSGGDWLVDHIGYVAPSTFVALVVTFALMKGLRVGPYIGSDGKWHIGRRSGLDY